MVAKFVRSNVSDPSLIYRFVRSNESYLSLTYCFVPPRGFIPIAIGTQLLYYQPACRRQEFVIRLQTCIPQKQGFFSNNPDSISSSYLRRDCKSRHLARPDIDRDYSFVKHICGDGARMRSQNHLIFATVHSSLVTAIHVVVT